MFKGIFTPMITVLDKEGKVDLEGNELIINSLIDGGVNGILFLGSTGEFFGMTLQEKKKFISFAIKTVNKRVKVLVGACGTLVEEVVELTRFIENEGADAAVVICPYYFKLDNQSVYNFYEEVASSVKLPIVIYNFPDRTGVNIDPNLVLKLAKDFDNIVGIKDTVDTLSHTRKLINTVKSEIKDFAVFSGYDEYLIPNLLAGGNGTIGALSNIAPELFAKFYKAFNEKDFETVATLQKEVSKFMALYDVAESFIPVLKEAVVLTGRNIKVGHTKPFGEVSEKQIEQAKEILRSINLI